MKKHLFLFTLLLSAASIVQAQAPGNKGDVNKDGSVDVMDVTSLVDLIMNPAAEVEYVDLGLPSGKVWASYNLGATQPEESGSYYMWGDIKGFPDEVTSCNWLTYPWGTASGFSKYCSDPSWGIDSFTDGKSTLEDADDAAKALWHGDWHIPSPDEWEELRTNCQWEWTTLNGVNGYKVTGPSTEHIFLPAAGQVAANVKQSDGVSGGYWTSALSSGDDADTQHARAYYFNISNYGLSNTFSRVVALSVRPVRDNFRYVTSLSLNASSLLFVQTGETKTLTATVTPANANMPELVWRTSNASVATVSAGTVRAVGNGSCVITASAADGSEKKAECRVDVAAVPLSYVDLGLSSGILWATANLGALTEVEHGYWYAWGELEGSDGQTGKSDFSWSTYRWCHDGSSSALTRYNTDSSKGYNNFNDRDKQHQTRLNDYWKALLMYTESSSLADYDGEDDAAVAMNAAYRMPTAAEWLELIAECSWEWTNTNGVNGYKVTGPNGRSLFLPAAGERTGTQLSSGTGAYWTMENDPSDTRRATAFEVAQSNGNAILQAKERCMGLSIRPVRARYDPANKAESLTVSASSINGEIGDIVEVTATISPNYATNQELLWTSDNEAVALATQGHILCLTAGTAHITVSTTDGSGLSQAIEVTVLGNNEHAYVDLGLPSGTLWATHNLGARTPEDWGNEYQWGQIIRFIEYEYDPECSTWGNQYIINQYSIGSDKPFYLLKKYCNDASYDNYMEDHRIISKGYSDDLTVLEEMDDMAAQTWGTGWRVPTKEQWEELVQYCSIEIVDRLGMRMLKFTSNANGRSIFFPYIKRKSIENNSTYQATPEQYLCYWTSSLYLDDCVYAWIYNFDAEEMEPNCRASFSFVRPVKAKK